MHKILFSPVSENKEGSIAYNFYREGVGFGQIEAQTYGTGRVAAITFEDEAIGTYLFSDINLELGFRHPSPSADIADTKVATRFIALGINSAVAKRRADLEAAFGDRLRKPRLRRALDRRLVAPEYQYS